MTQTRSKLGPIHIHGFLNLYCELDREFADLRSHLADRRQILARIESGLFGWGGYYELPFQVQAAMVLKYTGVLGPLRAAALSNDPGSALLTLATQELPDEFVMPASQQRRLVDFFGLVVSIRNSVRAVGCFGKWLNELLTLARSGDDGALFDAISMDPCVLGAPYVQHRLALATFQRDRAFVEAVSKALLGPSKKISQQINKVRFAAKILVDDGSLPTSNAELVDLFCNKLGLYPATGDPAKALRKLLKVVTPSSTT